MRVEFRVPASTRIVFAILASTWFQVSAAHAGPSAGRAAPDSVLTELCHGWIDSVPRDRLRTLGPPMLPMLTRALRDDSRRRCWSAVCAAIGSIGDSTYGDTLRAFVWDRFRGEVELSDFVVLVSAQRNISWLAEGSRRHVDYLLKTSDPKGWKGLPWRRQGYTADETARDMANHTIESMAVVDDARVAALLDTLSADWFAQLYSLAAQGRRTPTRHDSTMVENLRQTSAAVHRMGLWGWWYGSHR